MNVATRLARNALFSTLLAGLFFAVAEGAMRLAGWPDPGLYADAGAAVWTLRRDLPARSVPFPERGTAFTVRTNALGYRGGPPAEGGVACLGDSTTFGWGVEEDEAWPARLAARLGRPVLNGGVPGYTTVQGLATLDTVLSARPRIVILGYLVRDAERAARRDLPGSDRAGASTPDLQLLRALRILRPAPAPGAPTTDRVPPADYRANLATLMQRVRDAGASPVLLAFPMKAPPAAHRAVLAAAHRAESTPLIDPVLPDEAFFAEDPLHLTPAGNDALAAVVAEALTPRLSGGPAE